jgi:hypothetical protein
LNTKQSICHRIAIASAILVAAGLAAIPAAAETTTIKVPFSFNVAGQSFPAGDYWIDRDNLGKFVTLAAKGSSQHFTSLIGPGAPPPWEHKVALKFDLVGQVHFLESIQYGTLTTGRLDKKALASERASSPYSGGQ